MTLSPIVSCVQSLVLCIYFKLKTPFQLSSNLLALHPPRPPPASFLNPLGLLPHLSITCSENSYLNTLSRIVLPPSLPAVLDCSSLPTTLHAALLCCVLEVSTVQNTICLRRAGTLSVLVNTASPETSAVTGTQC